MNKHDKQYILMCEKGYNDLLSLMRGDIAPGTLFKFPDDDVFRMVISEHEISYSEKLYNYTVVNLKSGCVYNSANIIEDAFIIWNQSQLQGMIRSGRNAWGEMQRVVVWAKEEMSRNYFSMEQLWLTFVMHELYQKKWDGKGWVKDAT